MTEPHHEFEFDYHRPWEHEQSFNEVLAEQIRKAPYFLISVAIHGVVLLALAGLAFLNSEESEVVTLEVAATPPPPEVEEEEPPEEIIEEIIEEPVLQETELEEVQEMETLEETGDPDFTSDSPFDSESWNNDIGLGGGAGGKYGQRGGRGGGKRGKGSPTEQAVADALQWLADHQSPEGYWDADEFMYEDKYPDEPPSEGPGNPVNDVGVTGLALLAFLGNGNTMDKGEYRLNVAKGIDWLKSVQQGNGLFGDEVGNPTLYNHSIATMAMGEAYYFAGRSPLLTRTIKNAVKVIINARNNYGAWRYSLEPNGANDSSITGWMVFALKTAEDGKIPISKDAYDGARAWFTQMTDAGTGRTGYALGEGGGPGSRPSRPLAELDRFPPEKSEALTAVALLCHIFMTDTDEVRSWKDHPDYDMLKKQADLILRTPPTWDPEGGANDMYYWYYATFALNQWGGDHWKKWKSSMEKTLLPSQRDDGNFKGSWDPNGPWGEEGGRVYSTAICALMLEVYYRYAKVLGAR